MFNAISEQPNGGLYTCAVSLSPTQEDLAAALNIPYDPSKTVIPTLALAGTNSDVITPEGMESLYNKLGGPKAMALRRARTTARCSTAATAMPQPGFFIG